MRIIQVNKFYYLRGGAEKYLLQAEKELKSQGHEVAVFAMKHPKNISSPYEKYFVSRVSFSEGGFINKVKAARRLFWSREAKKKFTHLVKDFKPDIIHLHNIYHHLSPSILKASQKYNIPVVMHLHDYKLICPNYQLFTQNKYCERCRGGHYYNCYRYRCLKNSALKSALASLAMFYHHSYLKIYEKNVNLLIAPSRFIKETFTRFSWPEDKIELLYNFSEEKYLQSPVIPEKDYILYLGRLSSEKGIDILIRALSKTQLKLKIAGLGPEEDNLKKLSRELGLEDRIEFLGFKDGVEKDTLIAEAKAIVIPSIWPENMPFSLLEAMAKAKVVLVSLVGGLGELIEDGINGFTFAPGSSQAISDCLGKLETADCQSIGLKARDRVKDLEARDHFQSLEKIYRSLIKK
ncbi:MAG: glycosyltransferase [Patescibacteria group bacterium]